MAKRRPVLSFADVRQKTNWPCFKAGVEMRPGAVRRSTAQTFIEADHHVAVIFLQRSKPSGAMVRAVFTEAGRQQPKEMAVQ